MQGSFQHSGSRSEIQKAIKFFHPRHGAASGAQCPDIPRHAEQCPDTAIARLTGRASSLAIRFARSMLECFVLSGGPVWGIRDA